MNRSVGAVSDSLFVRLRLLALLEAATQATAAGHVPNHHRLRATRKPDVELGGRSRMRTAFALVVATKLEWGGDISFHLIVGLEWRAGGVGQEWRPEVRVRRGLESWVQRRNVAAKRRRGGTATSLVAAGRDVCALPRTDGRYKLPGWHFWWDS